MSTLVTPGPGPPPSNSLSNVGSNGERILEVKVPKGVPSPLLIQLLLQYITSAGNILDQNVEAVLHPLICTNLLQLLSTLTRWQYISSYESKEVFTALHSFLQKLRYAVINARQMSLHSLPLPPPKSRDNENDDVIVMKDKNVNAKLLPIKEAAAIQGSQGTSSTRSDLIGGSNLAEELLLELSCVVASYISVLTSVWIKGIEEEIKVHKRN